MIALVAQPEGIGHDQIRIRHHERLQAMGSSALPDFVGVVRAHRDDLHLPLLELWPKLFPSPQLGDTVWSPVRTEELDKQDMAVKATGVERLTVFVDGGEVRDYVSHLDGLRRNLLTADRDG